MISGVNERSGSLRRRDLDADPLAQFRRWFDDARAVVPMPEAVALATATLDGAPSARMVLLKRWDENGLVFHTNYESRKGRELEANPRAALLVYWHDVGRQVRAEGGVTRVTPEESEAYFRTRPLGGQLGAWASRQSTVLSGRDELDAALDRARAEFGDAPPVPPHWGGYRLSPETWEFWQHRDDRLHDRFRYRRDAGGWTIERLAP